MSPPWSSLAAFGSVSFYFIVVANLIIVRYLCVSSFTVDLTAAISFPWVSFCRTLVLSVTGARAGFCCCVQDVARRLLVNCVHASRIVVCQKFFYFPNFWLHTDQCWNCWWLLHSWSARNIPICLLRNNWHGRVIRVCYMVTAKWGKREKPTAVAQDNSRKHWPLVVAWSNTLPHKLKVNLGWCPPCLSEASLHCLKCLLCSWSIAWFFHSLTANQASAQW